MAKYNEETGEIEFEPEDWEREDNPYQKRFNDYRSEADRRATEYSQNQKLLSDLQSEDPAAQRAAAQRLGLEWIDEEPVEQGPDQQYSALAQQIEELKAERAAEKAQAEQAAESARIAAEVDRRLGDMGLDEQDGDWVLARAVALAPGADGLPDLTTAYEQLQERDRAAQERWRTSKKSPRIARGETGQETKNIMDMTDEERIDYLMEKHDVQ